MQSDDDAKQEPVGETDAPIQIEQGAGAQASQQPRVGGKVRDLDNKENESVASNVTKARVLKPNDTL